MCHRELPGHRDGNEKFKPVRKVPNTRKFDEVTLKRGLVGADDLFQWIRTVRRGYADPRRVQITMLDEARNPVATFTLHNAPPKKYTSSTLAAQGGARWRWKSSASSTKASSTSKPLA